MFGPALETLLKLSLPYLSLYLESNTYYDDKSPAKVAVCTETLQTKSAF
jgi:hypothetical protein